MIAIVAYSLLAAGYLLLACGYLLLASYHGGVF